MEDEKGFKVTRRALDAFGPADRSERGKWHSDRELPGFYAIAYDTGEIVFAVRFRCHGRRRMVRLGHFPSTSPEAARKEALGILGAAARGEDEAEKRKKIRANIEALSKRITFRRWREMYLEDAARRLKSTRDPERYLGIAGTEWDGRPLDEITTRDVEALRNRIAEKGSTQANRFLANVRSAFSHAFRLGYVDVNPAARVPLLKENAPRFRVLSEAEEARLRAAVPNVTDPLCRAAFALLLDTGVRSSEVLRAQWRDFDLKAGTWTIPTPKTGRPQAVPLLPETVAILKATPRVWKSPWLLPGTGRSGHLYSLDGHWTKLRDAAGLGADLWLPDIRRTFGLRATRRVGIFGASKLLRHSDSRVTEKVYAPLAPEDLRVFAVNTAKKGSRGTRKPKKKVKS